MIRGKKEGDNYSTWFIGFDHDSDPEEQTTIPGGPASAGVGGTRPMSAASAPSHTGRLLPPSSSSSTPASRQHRPRTPEPSRRLLWPAKELDKPGAASGGDSSSLLKPLPKWDEDRPGKGQVKKVTKDLYKHAFESAREAEEGKFKAKFDVVLTDLHHTLDKHSSCGLGLVDSFASASYGEVLLAFRGKIKDLLIVFSRRLQLAYESFDSQDAAEDHSQQVKQNVSRFLEDLIGETLDLTSDEAVSDLSSLSDDSSNERHAFEDQLAQALVSKILENHRREDHHGLRDDRHRLAASLIPEPIEEEEDDDADGDYDDADGEAPPCRNRGLQDTDISKDFQDLKNFVRETQSRSWRYEDASEGVDPWDREEGVTDFRGRAGARASSGVEVNSRDRDFPPLPDFSDLEQIDFESGEVDPDLLQMNLAVIPEETEEELEEEAQDSQWRDNWIFKGQGPPPPPSHHADRRRIRGEDDAPQYLMVPRPEDHLTPRVGSRDVDQLSDLSDDDLADDVTSFYPRTSEELARISRYKRSSTPPSLHSASLIPSPADDDVDPHSQDTRPPGSLRPGRKSSSPSSPPNVYDGDLDFEDVGVGTDDFVGPIVEPTQKELKLLDSLVPADGDDPRFAEAPESVSLQEGEPVKFSCRLSGTEPIDVFWYREQAEVEELEEGEDVEMREEEGGRHGLTLYHIGRQQAGQYMCIALSDLGKAIKYLTVTVKDNKQELKKPEFLKDLKDVEVLEGQSVKFRCKVKGYPPPRIHWYKDGCLLMNNKSCRIEKFGNRDYILTLEHVTMDDDAEYMVLARNVAGETRSTAQLIVEPRADGHCTPPKNESCTLTTLTRDTDTGRSTSSVTTHTRGETTAQVTVTCPNGRVPGSEVSEEESRDRVGQLVDSGVVTEEELNMVSQHLEEMERHLDGAMGRQSPLSPRLSQGQSAECVDSGEEEEADPAHTTQTPKAPRKLTPTTLRVLQAAEVPQQAQKKPAAPATPDLPPRAPPSTVPTASSRAQDSRVRTASRRGPSPEGHTDLATPVSPGHGSSPVSPGTRGDSDGVWAGSSPSGWEPPSPRDEWAECLPPPGDNGSGSYREEVSISLSAGSGGKPNNTASGAAAAASGTSSTAVTQPSTRARDTRVSTSVASDPSGGVSSVVVVPSAQTPSVPRREATNSGAPARRVGAGTGARWPETKSSSVGSSGDTQLVLNLGPKEMDTAAYGRDYEVRGREEGRAERKRWSVTLDPYSPAADVVNRRHVEEGGAEEKTTPSHGRTDGSTPQINPRSARDGSSSSSSTLSTSRESLDSGVSFTPSTPFTPERAERPHPVHLVGETREEEVPESRAEYDADSGVELPSVSRLKAMFGQGSGKGEAAGQGGGFKRVHSITARSLSKEQLQKLRDGGGPQHRDPRLQSRSAIQLHAPGPARGVQEDQPGKAPPAVRAAQLSPREQHGPAQAQRGTLPPPSEGRQVRTINSADYAQRQQQQRRDPGRQHTRAFPDPEEHGALNHSASSSTLSRGRAKTARPKSAILEGPARSVLDPVTPRARARSESDSADNPGAATKPKIRSGCISARTAFWERRILQGEGADDDGEATFPEMLEEV